MRINDPYPHMRDVPTGTAGQFYKITPSNDRPLPIRPRAIRVGAAGDVTAAGEDGVDVVFAGCYAGEVLDIRPVFVRAAGTTAGGLVALV
ncbi:spike base protein, RCAP_Rcc01079 family [Burkholderia stagnalis]|uniref:spike base protein, RCAP_Rcc01079 family n=1 Tax=Burkholderia stagnalis TaxID=1503054 RepID=UPI00325C32E4